MLEAAVEHQKSGYPDASILSEKDDKIPHIPSFKDNQPRNTTAGRKSMMDVETPQKNTL